MSVLRLNEFTARPGQLENLAVKMRGFCNAIREIPGCQCCEVLLKMADGETADDQVIVLEVWDSIEAHKSAASAIDPGDIATVMALLAGPPKGQYYQAV